MQILVLPSAGVAARSVAQYVARSVRDQPDIVLGLPTGRTMIPVYRELVTLHRRGRADFKRVTTFNLDEFAGLGQEHPGSFRSFMQEHLFDGINLRPRAVWFPEPNGAALTDYDRRIDLAGGLDLCLVGIGVNGHLGFNEPASHLAARTHRVRLMPATRKANAYLFRSLGDVPREAVSMGIATIMNARTIVLLATGRSKARIVRRALTGPVTPRVPASFTQTHPNVVVVLDRAAASELKIAGGRDFSPA